MHLLRMVLLPTPRRIVLTEGVHNASQALPIHTSDSKIFHREGYRLSVTRGEIRILSNTPAGAFYAEQTLKQIRRQYPESLPCLEIEDWPDFPARGVMLDISRDKVPTMQTLLGLIDMLAEWKINQLQLYTEHTFAYSKHRLVWENASPLTAEEIQQLNAYCRDRFIDLVPNQNSFGHMERWLKHQPYAHLAEAIDGAQTPWGFRWKGPFSLCPTDPESIVFLADLYAELLPNFSSKFFNVGCDETFDIGQGRSRAECDRIGVHRVYVGFLHKVRELVIRNGKQMMFWGDFILHQPEMIKELPGQIIALHWGYEADHPFDKEAEHFKNASVPFYVCPGTSSWNSIAGRTQNAIDNLRAAAESGMRHGAIGYLITDWGDNGHLQYLPISYPGFAAGAAFSWCLRANDHLDLPAVLNHHAFHHATGSTGEVLIDLGNVYRVCGKHNANGSALFRLLVNAPSDAHPESGMTEEGFVAAEAVINSALAKLEPANDAQLELIGNELKNAADILRLCIAVGRQKLGFSPSLSVDVEGIAVEHRRLWLARNLAGGLEDSVGRIDQVG